jgi:hypothetical protein
MLNLERFCPACKDNKDVKDFYISKGKPCGYCKTCTNKKSELRRKTFPDLVRIEKDKWYRKNIDDIRLHRIEKSYNISAKEFKDILDKQNNKCYICGFNFILGDRVTSPQIDHNHKCCPDTGKCCGKCIRKLLCNNCNNGLGRFRDNPELLDKAASYLREYL